MSSFKASSSWIASTPSSRDSIAARRECRSFASDSLTQRRLRRFNGTDERNAIVARQHSIDVENHDQLLADLRDPANEVRRESAKERRWRRDVRRGYRR